MSSGAGPAIPSAQREILAQALADAVCYRDPPLRCPDCDALAVLCPQCGDQLSRARAYLTLGRKLGISPPSPSPPAAPDNRQVRE
jgi:hypothetical protein